MIQSVLGTHPLSVDDTECFGYSCIHCLLMTQSESLGIHCQLVTQNVLVLIHCQLGTLLLGYNA